MTQYALAEHVFLCLNDEHVVFLDVKADRYWALEAASTAGLSMWIRGWPVPARWNESSAMPMGEASEKPTKEATKDPTEEQAAALEILTDRGMLVQEGSGGKEATPVSINPPIDSLVHETETFDSVRSRDLPAFLAASLSAKWLLRVRRFDRVIARVARRKGIGRMGAPIETRERRADMDTARQLVRAFIHWRMFLFSSRDECLYDSLCLLEFLARRAVYPSWVFGVQTRPFVAHCWVQHGSLVFNDTAEHVSSYTPIMVV